MTVFSLALESGNTGLWYGRFIELPGTHARSQDRQSLLEVLREELLYHDSWLRKHGEQSRIREAFSMNVAEEIHDVVNLGESGGEVATFEFDRRTVTTRMLDHFIRLMGHNRQDLLGLVSDLTPQQMSNIPEGKKRDITGILQHVCNAEEFYLSRLGAETDQKYEKYEGTSESEVDKLPVFQRLEVVRRACVMCLRDVVPKKGATMFTRAEYTNNPSEQWTAYKVMRRYLEHEREHYYNIREYLGLPAREGIKSS
ncbi:MAG: hypothetical protein C4K47_04365 [Candidatus Thorarchaeota archaeon]|nr:MAG: hypothetical protein C4K47_04365 [Candidatus Thorarchaeota archaeon]